MERFTYYKQVTVEEANAALKSLGRTERSVHRKLRELRLKGRGRSSASCIIAKFLQGKFPKKVISVGYNWSYVDGHLIEMPAQVTSLIEHFDAGKYPELTSPKKC